MKMFYLIILKFTYPEKWHYFQYFQKRVRILSFFGQCAAMGGNQGIFPAGTDRVLEKMDRAIL
jgi:hypothetical protein